VLRNRLLIRPDYSAYELGYTRHRILGTRLFATVIVRSPVDSLEEKTFSPEAFVGMPLTADQTLTLQYEDTSFREHTLQIAGRSVRRLHFERTLAASWTRDTRDAPYTPMRGTYARVEPFVAMSDFASFLRQPPDGVVPRAQHLTATGLELAAERHWPLSDVSSFSAGVQAGWASVRQRENPTTLPSDVRWRPSFEVIQGGYARKLGASYLELEGRVALHQVNADDSREVVGSGLTGTSYEVALAWTRRSPRGVLRLGFAYTH
jgi:hypothetical protein